ncbi:glutamate-1-semialdehyde aminotransferase [Mollisia scopiformis]|uniref:Glutamate-1-semialdehyde aminotransferase n=1 Tax=Mollisia scopiformis TaxID=149040 RepID=A0A194XAH9_MOLSC|nr:glutamate-1-semialdehyde aminotransferase [Mollisia scopiformis]KUJ17149.1 glutamate-1-semialdehyde aminotransferase [Mollisia scopiformis]
MPKANSPPTSPVAELGLTVKSQVKTSSGLSAAVEAAKQRFVERNPASAKFFEDATEYLPGGNTRTLLYSAPFPICMKKGENYQVFDEDGHTYTDFVGELTAALYGHSHPLIKESLINTINTVGLNLGATIAQEAKHAKLICERFNLSKVRFCNSGTEANLHALAGVRHFTGKRKVVVFSGGYHGAVLGFWDGVQENGVDKHEWVIGKYNDVEGAKKLIEQDDIAAVLVEGMQGAGGCILGTNEFLLQLQESARKVGACFILDEVMTSRLGPSGLQGIEGLSPDITTFGKYLGGGLAFGAFGGRADIMAVYDPRSPNSLAHSGTFNNNTLAMNAGFVGLSEIWKPDVAVEFNKIGDAFRASLQEVTNSTKMSVTGRGALNAIHFSDNGLTKISCREDIDEDWGLKDLFYMEMMEDGFWITRRGSIAMILDTPQSELDRFVDCVGKFLERHKSLVSL